MAPRPTHRRRPLSTVAIIAMLTLLVSAIGVAKADAAAYRYWGYFTLKGQTWSFATKGAAQTTPADGSVEGWRWAVAGETDVRTPRDVLTFDEICSGTEAKSGTKRVGVVLDFGRVADAESGNPPTPIARCAQVPTAATGAQVLDAVSDVRQNKGMVCGVDSWPASGCGGEVKQVSSSAGAKDTSVTIKADNAASEQDDDGIAAWKIAVPAAIVLVLLVGALLLVLRRRRVSESA
ncbi:SCO2322 family protein [Dermacoccaceae bacterium W4C1]